jgi:hypothetical protein
VALFIKKDAPTKLKSAWNDIQWLTGSDKDLKQMWAVGLAVFWKPSGLWFCDRTNGLLVHAAEISPHLQADTKNKLPIVKNTSLAAYVKESISYAIKAHTVAKAQMEKAHELFAKPAAPGSILSTLPKLKSQPIDLTADDAAEVFDAQDLSFLKKPMPLGTSKTFQATSTAPMKYATKEGDIMNGPTINLKSAEHLYQPVHGTSAGSRYFVVARGEGVNVAVKYNGAQLSIRIEGPKLLAHKNAIIGVGFDTFKPDYASLHLGIANDIPLARKTLGAILMGLGIAIDTPFPDFAKIALKQ